MNTNNLPKRAASSSEIPAKRRRGRPRKDDNISRRGIPQVPIAPAVDITRNILQQPVLTVNPNIPRIDNNTTIQVGQSITGVIESAFDAGYFIAVRVGESSTILKGVVFHPGRIVPITPANDIAPNARMYQRGEFPVPVPQVTMQPAQLVGHHSVAPMAANPVVPLGPQSLQPPVATIPPVVLQKKDSSSSLQEVQVHIVDQGNLRMVEQDDVMQVFEVSKLSEKPVNDSVTIYPNSETQSLESGMKPGGMVQNDSSCMNLGAHYGSNVSEPQTGELVHSELKSPTHGPDHPLIEGTTHSLDCVPKPAELVQQERNSSNLETVESFEITKDGTVCSEKAVSDDGDVDGNESAKIGGDESSFQGKEDQPQAPTSAVQTTAMDFVEEDPAVQPTH